MRVRSDKGFVVGGSIIGSAIGDGSVVANSTINWNGDASAASLHDLRAAIASLQAEVDAAGGEFTDTEEVKSELGQLEKEVNKDEPDGEMVRVRWKLVQKLLGPLENVAKIAQLTDRILTLIGGN